MKELARYFPKEEFVPKGVFKISEIKEEFNILHKNGYSICEISRKLNISMHTAFKILEELKWF